MRLAAEGYDLELHYHSSRDAIDETAARCREQGANARLLQADLTRPDQIEALCEGLDELHLLVNNAAVFFPTPKLADVVERWDEFQSLNLKAPLLMVTELRSALARTRGCVVNIVDIWARHPLRRHLAYSVSKAGLAALTRGLALELAPDIRVNGVAPGAALLPAGAPPEAEARLLEEIPLKQLGGPEEIAAAVTYLAGARFVTGHILTVDGGRSVNL